MPIDYYPNLGADDLRTLLETLQERQTSGIITQSSVAGFENRKDYGKSASRNDVELRRVMYSLWLRDPTSPNPYATRISRTRARYTFS